MVKPRLNGIRIPTDRWSARVVSPVDIRCGIDETKYGPVVLVHPGWGKNPERYAQLLIDLANEGFLGLGIDTRFAYSDRSTPRSALRNVERPDSLNQILVEFAQ